jgi:cobalt-zinc-cadmium efflux system membrane fusion protein
MRNRWIVFMLALSLGAVLGACNQAGKQASPGGTAKAVAGACAKHGIPDSICPFCHPEFVEQRGPCTEHGVPEALCYQCNPALVPAFQVEATGAGAPASGVARLALSPG